MQSPRLHPPPPCRTGKSWQRTLAVISPYRLGAVGMEKNNQLNRLLDSLGQLPPTLYISIRILSGKKSYDEGGEDFRASFLPVSILCPSVVQSSDLL